MANRNARANGGHLLHLLPENSNTSLCGHTPKRNAHHMKQRGKWFVYGPDAPWPKTATKCRKCFPGAHEEDL